MKILVRDCVVRDAGPEEIADAFCAMDEEQQAAVFNTLGYVTAEWLPSQLGAIIKSGKLNARGLRVMRLIGEYAQP